MRKRRDSYCADGMISDGERVVRKGGVVKFGRQTWSSPKLVPFEGDVVTVYMNDYWMTEAFAARGSDFIDNLKREGE